MTRIHSRFRGTSPRRAARSPQTVVRPEGVVPPFGGGCRYVETDDILETSDTVGYQTHLTLGVLVPADGDYFFGAYAYYTNSANTASDCDMRIRRGTTTLVDMLGNTAGLGGNTAIDAGDSFNCLEHSEVLTLAAGFTAFTIAIRMGTPFGAGEFVGLYYSAMEFWSFN